MPSASPDRPSPTCAHTEHSAKAEVSDLEGDVPPGGVEVTDGNGQGAQLVRLLSLYGAFWCVRA